MAGLNSTSLSLIDVTKRLDPNGKVASTIAELLTETNEILQDIPWQEGNLPTGHRVTIRTGLPSSTFRRFNEGVAQSKSTTVQVEEGCAMIEQRGGVDKDLAMLNGNTAEFRLSENIPHMEALSQDFADTLFYADANTNPEKFSGLAPRYDSLSAGNAQNIIVGGGSGADNTSVWLIGWGDKGVYGIYPKGSKAGIHHMPIKDGSEDGCVDQLDANGNSYRAFVDHYQWKCGIAVKDWRYAVRIANVDVSALVAESGNADLIKLMSRALDRIPTAVGVNLRFYCNRTVFSFLKIQGLNKSNAALNVQDALLQFGEKTVTAKIPHFLGVPIRICDAITETEAAVS
jgi:hypothetical protein